jgi:hypothetical protein
MMSISAGHGALDYLPCRYGTSRLVFRGPRRDLSRSYIAVLGGSATFGKYVARPYADLVEQATGHPVANLGSLQAGPDFYLADPAVLDVAAAARVAVVQITGAETLSNPCYTVHSRRNDRFLAATPALRALYPCVDFTDIHYTGHLLQVLFDAGPDRFLQVVRTLQDNWLQKMLALLARLPARRLLLWLADTAPPLVATRLGPGPAFIDQGLIDRLRDKATKVVQVCPSARARSLARFDMIFPETEAPQARGLPGAAGHAEVAAALAPVLGGLLQTKAGPPLGDPVCRW